MGAEMTLTVEEALRHFDPGKDCDNEYWDDDWNPEEGEDHKSEDPIWRDK